ncbi:MAG: hypothetical protein JSW04_01480 [Desulfobacterales bacterium]|nr:MAG: hypothetical protein JSW04_01480 [Desulfobacterales bacterium]
MKTTQRPIRNTIVFGLVFGLAFIPLNSLLGYVTDAATAFKIILWTYLATYGFFLTRWGRNRPISIFFPLLLLLIFVFIVNSNSAYLLLALIIFSWIRSGVCFQQSLSKMLGAELLLSLGGAILVAWFAPCSTFTWALGILMFFLVQSIYFVIFENKNHEQVPTDPFEEAMVRAEKIIS